MSNDPVVAALAGDPTAIVRYMMHHRERWRSVLHGGLPQRARGVFETDDLVQEALLGILKSQPLKQFASRDHLDSWIHTVVIRELQNLIRYRRAAKRAAKGETQLKTNHADRLLRAPNTGPLTAAQRSELVARFEAVVRAHLDPDDQQLVRLRVLDELEFRDIGERLGITTEAAHKRFFRLWPGFAPMLARQLGLERGEH